MKQVTFPQFCTLFTNANLPVDDLCRSAYSMLVEAESSGGIYRCRAAIDRITKILTGEDRTEGDEELGLDWVPTDSDVDPTLIWDEYHGYFAFFGLDSYREKRRNEAEMGQSA